MCGGCCWRRLELPSEDGFWARPSQAYERWQPPPQLPTPATPPARSAAVKSVCAEYRIHNADVHVKGDYDIDDLVGATAEPLVSGSCNNK